MELLGEVIATNNTWVAIHGTDLSQRMVDISLECKCGSGGRSIYSSVSNLYMQLNSYRSLMKHRSTVFLLLMFLSKYEIFPTSWHEVQTA